MDKASHVFFQLFPTACKILVLGRNKDNSSKCCCVFFKKNIPDTVSEKKKIKTIMFWILQILKHKSLTWQGYSLGHSVHKQSWRLENIFGSLIKIHKGIKRGALGGNFSPCHHKRQTTGVILYNHIAMFFSNMPAKGYSLIIS